MTERQEFFTPQEWTRGMLFDLADDTTWWCYPVAHDYYDIRAHLLTLYQLARWVGQPDPLQKATPPTIVEIGVRHGIATMALLTGARDVDGRVHSVEINPHWVGVASERVRAAGLLPWWTVTCADSRTYEAPRPIDLLFIDGAHDLEMVRSDVGRFLPLVRRNGLMAMHDYYSTLDPTQPPLAGPHPSEVSIVVDELRNHPGLDVLTLPWSFGLTLVRVR